LSNNLSNLPFNIEARMRLIDMFTELGFRADARRLALETQTILKVTSPPDT
jgi:hypothetical protein